MNTNYQFNEVSSVRQRRKQKENSLFGSVADVICRELQRTAETLSYDYTKKLEDMYSRDDVSRMKNDYTKKLKDNADKIFRNGKITAIQKEAEYINNYKEMVEKIRPDLLQRQRISSEIAALTNKEREARVEHYINTGSDLSTGQGYEMDALDILAASLRATGQSKEADKIRRYDTDFYHTHEGWRNEEDFDCLAEAVENIDLIKNHFEQGGKLYLNPGYEKAETTELGKLFPDMQ